MLEAKFEDDPEYNSKWSTSICQSINGDSCPLKKWDTLRNLVSFVRLEKRKNTHGGALLLVKLQAALKVTLLHGCFSRFLNCTEDVNSR